MQVTDIAANFKRRYAPVTEPIFYSSMWLYKSLAKNRATKKGGDWYVPIDRLRNYGHGPAAATEMMPTARYEVIENAVFSCKRNFHAIELDIGVLETAKGGDTSFWNTATMEMTRAITNMQRLYSIEAFSDGSGALANITASVTGQTLNVDNTTWLEKGMPIIIATKADGIIISSGQTTINSIDEKSSTVTVADSVTVTTAESLYLPLVNDAGTGAKTRNQFMSGLPAITGQTNTYGGIDRSVAANSWWISPEVDGSTNGLTPAIIDEAVTAIGKNNGNANIIICHPYQYNKYANLVYGARRTWNDRIEKLDWGVQDGIAHNNIPVKADYLCPIHDAWVGDLRKLTLLEDMPIGWIEYDGAMLRFKPGSGNYYQSVQGTLMGMHEIACANPGAWAHITNLPYP